jgi:monovalent cation:H+ antiporter-2, CPA2 family
VQHELPLLVNITVALVAAFVGGLLARRLKLPSIVGYMLAGVAIGPFTPGFVGDLFTSRKRSQSHFSNRTVPIHLSTLCLVAGANADL